MSDESVVERPAPGTSKKDISLKEEIFLHHGEINTGHRSTVMNGKK